MYIATTNSKGKRYTTVDFLQNSNGALDKYFNMLIKLYTTNSGLLSSSLWWVLYLVGWLVGWLGFMAYQPL